MTQTVGYVVKIDDKTSNAVKSINRRLKALDAGFEKLSASTKRSNVSSKAFSAAMDKAIGPVARLRANSNTLGKSLERQRVVSKSLTGEFSNLSRQISKVSVTINRAEQRMKRFRLQSRKATKQTQQFTRGVFHLRNTLRLLIGGIGCCRHWSFR